MLVFQDERAVLCHIISGLGVKTDPDKSSVLKYWPVPTDIKELRSFLGFSNYYRWFVCYNSKIMNP